MICTRLDGGLGNQLFQYAIGRSLAEKYQCDLLLDISHLGNADGKSTKRVFELNHFQHIGRVASRQELGLSWFTCRFPTLLSFFSPWTFYFEKGLGYNSKFINLTDSTYLVGYWQSFFYFHDIREILFSELTPVLPLSVENSLIEKCIRNTNSVSIHVRRGDYIENSRAAKFHGVLGLDYYKNALSVIFNEVDDPIFFIFSDDIEWCRKNLSIDSRKMYFIGGNSGGNAWQDLFLMSNCRHNIIANSSFSWWGAWISDQRYLGSKRVVVAPTNWFMNHKNVDIVDRIPPHWVRLP